MFATPRLGQDGQFVGSQGETGDPSRVHITQGSILLWVQSMIDSFLLQQTSSDLDVGKRVRKSDPGVRTTLLRVHFLIGL